MTKPLPRVNDLHDFRESYLLKHAVIVTGFARSIPAARWGIPYLTEVLSSQRPTVRLRDGRYALMKMGDFFRYLENTEPLTSKVGPPYLTDFYLKPSFGDPERDRLGSQVRFPLLGDDEWPEWRERHVGWNTLYAGPAGTRTPLHQDPFATTSWLAQISGTKAWRICEPSALTLEIAGALEPFSDAPMPCEFFDAVLEPGDVMYTPPGWWHAVENETTSIAVTGNFVTVEEGRASLARVQSLHDCSDRDVWRKTWTAALAEVDRDRTASAA